MRYALIALWLIACGNIATVPYEFDVQTGRPDVFEVAADYWRPHGFDIRATGPGAPWLIDLEELPDGQGDGVTQGNRIAIDPAYVDQPLLLAHELGHVLGLHHVTECAVMQSPRVCDAKAPTMADLEQLP